MRQFQLVDRTFQNNLRSRFVVDIFVPHSCRHTCTRTHVRTCTRAHTHTRVHTLRQLHGREEGLFQGVVRGAFVCACVCVCASLPFEPGPRPVDVIRKCRIQEVEVKGFADLAGEPEIGVHVRFGSTVFAEPNL